MNGAPTGAASQTGVTGARLYERMGHEYWQFDRQHQMGQQERWVGGGRRTAVSNVEEKVMKSNMLCS